MSISAIVQARSSSVRLPRKVLLEVDGRPLLQYVIERLEHAERLDSVIVATSTDASDDAIANLCMRLSVDCDRGPLDDVAARFLGAAERRGLDAFVRVSGDSPLLDQRLVDQAVDLLGERSCDLATNVFPRSFPAGQSVEAIFTDVFQGAYERMVDPSDLEHVTPLLYRHPEEFRICSFTAETDLSALRLAVDTAADLAFFTRVLGAMNRPHWTYDVSEIVGLARGISGTASA